MPTVTMNELKSNIEHVLQLVEAGNAVSILRDGEVVAEIKSTRPTVRPIWKDRPALVNLSRPNAWSEALVSERSGDDR